MIKPKPVQPQTKEPAVASTSDLIHPPLKRAVLDKSTLWTYYSVRWTFITQLVASVPADPNLMDAWLRARMPKVKPPGGKAISEIHEEIFSTLAEPEEDVEARSLLVFQRHEGNLVMRAATVRAHIKDCARVMGPILVGKVQGEKSWASRVVNTVYPDETAYWIPILHQDGTPFTTPDAVRDKAIHLPTGQSAIKSFEYVNDAMMQFRIKVLGGNIAQEDLEALFLFAGTHGYAGERSDGEGKYICTLTKEEPHG